MLPLIKARRLQRAGKDEVDPAAAQAAHEDLVSQWAALAKMLLIGQWKLFENVSLTNQPTTLRHDFGRPANVCCLVKSSKPVLYLASLPSATDPLNAEEAYVDGDAAGGFADNTIGTVLLAVI